MANGHESNNQVGPPLDESPPTARGLTGEQRAFAAVVGQAIAEAWLKRGGTREVSAAAEVTPRRARDSLKKGAAKFADVGRR
jgi:hypothetical protein